MVEPLALHPASRVAGTIGAMRPADLQLDLDSFEGPFDLLCTMLLRRELPLSDVALVEVVAAYLQVLSVRGDIDGDTASEFLVLVAGLLEIKAKELLAAGESMQMEDVVGVEETSEQMFERLVAYSTFRNAAAWLGQQGETPRYWRVASRPVVRRRETPTQPVFDPAILPAALDVLLRQTDVDVRHLVGKHASIQEMSARLVHLVRERASLSFEDAVEGCSRLDQAVAFVAALELAKNGAVRLLQSERFGAIEIERSEAAQTAPVESNASDEVAIA